MVTSCLVQNVKTAEDYAVVNFEVAGSSSFRYKPENNFAMAADIDDRIKRKHIRVSLNKDRF